MVAYSVLSLFRRRLSFFRILLIFVTYMCHIILTKSTSSAYAIPDGMFPLGFQASKLSQGCLKVHDEYYWAQSISLWYSDNPKKGISSVDPVTWVDMLASLNRNLPIIISYSSRILWSISIGSFGWRVMKVEVIWLLISTTAVIAVYHLRFHPTSAALQSGLNLPWLTEWYFSIFFPDL